MVRRDTGYPLVDPDPAVGSVRTLDLGEATRSATRRDGARCSNAGIDGGPLHLEARLYIGTTTTCRTVSEKKWHRPLTRHIRLDLEILVLANHA